MIGTCKIALFTFKIICFCKIYNDYVTFSLKNLAVKRICRNFAALEPAKPLNDAQMCGSFYFIYNEQQSSFSKAIQECA